MSEKIVSILGKDYLTLKEAAYYCGVCESQFRKLAATYGLESFEFMGKRQYRKPLALTGALGPPAISCHATTPNRSGGV